MSRTGAEERWEPTQEVLSQIETSPGEEGYVTRLSAIREPYDGRVDFYLVVDVLDADGRLTASERVERQDISSWRSLGVMVGVVVERIVAEK